jgi:hypothetical protein
MELAQDRVQWQALVLAVVMWWPSVRLSVCTRTSQSVTNLLLYCLRSSFMDVHEMWYEKFALKFPWNGINVNSLHINNPYYIKMHCHCDSLVSSASYRSRGFFVCFMSWKCSFSGKVDAVTCEVQDYSGTQWHVLLSGVCPLYFWTVHSQPPNNSQLQQSQTVQKAY